MLKIPLDNVLLDQLFTRLADHASNLSRVSLDFIHSHNLDVVQSDLAYEMYRYNERTIFEHFPTHTDRSRLLLDLNRWAGGQHHPRIDTHI